VNVKGVFHLTRALLPLPNARQRRGPGARDQQRLYDGLRVPLLETYAYSRARRPSTT